MKQYIQSLVKNLMNEVDRFDKKSKLRSISPLKYIIMKKQMVTLWKKTILLCLLVVISLSAHAQLGKKPKSAASGKLTPSITSPTDGSVIGGPFVLVGKAEPNTTVNVTISPIYAMPKSTDGKPVLRVSTPLHERQEFTAKADANGVWQSRVVEVHYDPKATGRRIFASVYQIWGNEILQSRNTEYM
ncbi:MAG: hypothetical protein EOO47_28080, partial [Flavobacterium sp.]